MGALKRKNDIARGQIQLAVDRLRRAKKKPKRLPRPASPIGLERGYLRDIRPYLEAFHALVQKLLISQLTKLTNEYDVHRPLARTDTASDDINDISRKIKSQLNNVFDEDRIRRMALSKANEVSEFNQKQVKGSVSNALGLDVVLHEPYLEDELAMFVTQNVQLIESIPEDALDKIQSMVYDAFRSGTRVEDLADQIMGYIDPEESPVASRAALIARDQVGKLNGQLNFLRQSELGVTSYIWRTVGDERVRESHAEKEGMQYDWDDPPADTGAPGEDYQCRCWAEPIFEDVDEDNPDQDTGDEE